MLTVLALLSAVPVVPVGRTSACTPTRVWDGDGPVWCAEGPRLRIAGIAARESDGTCRPGQPCPKATAQAARDALASLIGRRTGRSPQGHVLISGPALRCTSTGNARGTRTGAWCVLPSGRDLSCAMVATRTVDVWPRYWGRHRCRTGEHGDLERD